MFFFHLKIEMAKVHEQYVYNNVYGIIYKNTCIQVTLLFCQKCLLAKNYLKNFNNCIRKRSNWDH